MRASLDLLRSGGIEALSMRKVAAELGVSVSTVYRWAGNKEQLLALELLFIGLLGLASLAIAWISGVVVYKLFKGQR